MKRIIIAMAAALAVCSAAVAQSSAENKGISGSLSFKIGEDGMQYTQTQSATISGVNASLAEDMTYGGPMMQCQALVRDYFLANKRVGVFGMFSIGGSTGGDFTAQTRFSKITATVGGTSQEVKKSTLGLENLNWDDTIIFECAVGPSFGVCVLNNILSLNCDLGLHVAYMDSTANGDYFYEQGALLVGALLNIEYGVKLSTKIPVTFVLGLNGGIDGIAKMSSYVSGNGVSESNDYDDITNAFGFTLNAYTGIGFRL